MVHFNISSAVFDTDLSSVYKFGEYHTNLKYFKLDQGEHYKIIAYLSKQCPDGSTTIDIGTFLGYSALALSVNPNIQVITYDINDSIPKDKGLTINDAPNITRYIKNCMEDMEDIDILLNSPLIILDVDPHDGIQEEHMIKRLIECKYTGVVVCDDIHLNDAMQNFWNWVPLKKVDLTRFGHWSGTGAIIFDPSVNDLEIVE